MTTIDLATSFLSTQHLLMGIDNLRQNNFQEAIFHFDSCIELTPEDKYAHWNKAMALLSLGEYEEGFKEHEWGWKLFDWRGFGPVRDEIDRLKKLPQWNGEYDMDAKLLVYHELGFGDAIQCMRYLDEIYERVGEVTLVINEEMETLVRRNFPAINVATSVPADLDRYDYRLPFFGVMHALNQNLGNIPSKPYIFSAGNCHPGKVGAVWAGRTNSFKFHEFNRLLNLSSKFSLYSLQPGPVDAAYVVPLVSKDFLETAKVISTMEHIVTVDTGVAHLAGAMGHPSTHVLLPYQGDWRWWNAKAWYPFIKTYRQESPGDWSKPFQQIKKALG